MDGAKPIPQAYITLEKGIIRDIGSIQAVSDTVRQRADFHDYSHLVACPGWINSHAHLAYRSLAQAPTDGGGPAWLKKLVTETKSYTPSVRLQIAHQNVQTLLKSGCTFVVENTPYEETIQALAESPLGGLIGWEVFGNDPSQSDEVFERTLHRWEDIRHKYHFADRLTFTLAPHSIYNVCPALLRKLGRWSGQENKPLLIHLSEFEFEQTLAQEGRPSQDLQEFHTGLGVSPSSIGGLGGLTPTGYLQELDLLNERLIPTHMTRANERDLELLAKHKIGICSCPRSGIWLSNGLLNWDSITRAGIKVSFGTDGLSSNFDLDLREELKTAWLLHKMRPNSLRAVDLFEGVTSLPARQFRLEKSLGSLAPGKRADLIAFQPPARHLEDSAFLRDPYEDLLKNSLSELKKVWIGGKQILPSI